MKIRYKVIGSMSGTSLDGLDLAYCIFEKQEERWEFEILNPLTIPYPEDIRSRLQTATTMSGIELLELDVDLGKFYAKHIKEYIQVNAFALDFISSHGHTVFHQPEKQITYQAGNGQLMANMLNLPVVNDFRSADVLAGGQGAPLVPIGDELLFAEYKACLNLGGIGNISFDRNGKRVAYDICPTNMVLNTLSNKMGLEYDPDGRNASKGIIIVEWLTELNKLTYYELEAPKSLGYEWVEKHILSVLDRIPGSIEDKLRTFVEHIAIQIATDLNKYIGDGIVLITGGGTNNQFLISRITHHAASRLQLKIPPTEIIEFKEALIFGFLGVLKWRGEINVLASVTGASKNHSSGTISLPML